MNRPLVRLILSGVVFLFCLAALNPPAKGQSQEVMVQSAGRTVRVCKPADLDSHLSFFRAKTYFTVAFNMRNISESPCVPQPAIGFPMYHPTQDPQVKPFELCMDCEDRLPDGTYRVRAPVVLNPGEIAHLTFRWNTVPSDEKVRCARLDAVFAPVLVVAPTLFDPVCSEIAVSRTYVGAYVPPVSSDQALADEVQSRELFILSAAKPRYYAEERFTLKVGLREPGSESPSGEECPTLFLRERSPDGNTRFDEVKPSGFKTCKSFWLGSNRSADWQSGFEVDAGVGSRWSGLGEHSFELFQFVRPIDGDKIQFIRSNKLAVQIDDPALIARKWVGKAKGLGVDVSLDKDTYQIGEDVPLHIAIENFNAPVPIYATDPLWDPDMAIGIEVRDATGRLLPENEKYPITKIWTGHGLGPRLFPPGKLVPIERSLASQHWLPNRSGAYTVVVTWCPVERSNQEPRSGLPRKGDFKAYATVQAGATFRIVGELPPTPAEP